MQPTSANVADDLSVPVETFPLTAAQRDIWLDQLSRGDSPLYNIGGYVELSGPLDPLLLHSALEQLVAANDALRTILLCDVSDDGLPLQGFARALPVVMPLHDFSEQRHPQSAAQALVEQQMAQPYTLNGQALFRFCLIRLDHNRHWLAAQAHHLIIDGWGFGLLFKSVGEIYSAL
jgi:arthrofactin-type cyclic lipopeptide synthetase A